MGKSELKPQGAVPGLLSSRSLQADQKRQFVKA